MSRYIVIGAGAVGAVLASRLYGIGGEVVLAGRPGAHVDAIRRHGLTVVGPHASESFSVPTVSSVSQVVLTGDDILLFAVKTQDIESALTEWAWHRTGNVLGADLPAVTFQNGLVAEPAAARRFTETYAATIGIASSYLRPGEVALPSVDPAGLIWLGRYPSGRDDLADEIVSDLVRADFAARSVTDITSWKAWKLVHNVTNGLDLFGGDDQLRTKARDHLAKEARTVLRADGLWVQEVSLPPAPLPPVPGYERHSSTWQSHTRGATSEIEWLNGEVSSRGRRVGIPTPWNDAVVRLLGSSWSDNHLPSLVELTNLADRAALPDTVTEGASA
jgi:2-dehydropantoate 2-reductase